MIASLRRRLRDSRGITSVEIMVSMMILASVVMGTAATSTTALHVATSGDQQSDMADAVQYQLETLLQDYDALTSGSAIVGEYAMKWEVTGSDPKKICLYVYDMSPTDDSAAPVDSDRAAFAPAASTGGVMDTVVVYLADPSP